jgi:hypothetical protein
MSYACTKGPTPKPFQQKVLRYRSSSCTRPLTDGPTLYRSDCLRAPCPPRKSGTPATGQARRALKSTSAPRERLSSRSGTLHPANRQQTPLQVPLLQMVHPQTGPSTNGSTHPLARHRFAAESLVCIGTETPRRRTKDCSRAYSPRSIPSRRPKGATSSRARQTPNAHRQTGQVQDG